MCEWFGSDLAAVYNKETTGHGLFFSNIHDLWYKYSAPVRRSRDLSYIIPIDTDGNGTSDFYAVADASSCRGTPNAAGVVYTVNITEDAVCGIVDGSLTTFPNWAAFAAAYPNARTANLTDNDATILVVTRGPAALRQRGRY